MNQRDIEKAERIEKLLKRLRNENKIVLVEGKNDRKSLKKLNINNEMVLVSENAEPLSTIAEKISRKHNEAIILTDWDPHGDKLSQQLQQVLERYGVTANDVYRRRLKAMLLKEINDVESLHPFYKNLKQNYSWL
ncbi:5S rRNA maturation endonuclease containing TOPRIM domain, RnmV [Methanonatronarchaeum thermophilum]|uniref:5S rRNA maturation endonuclease containing TOPRIM domain, RnmV n=1 Tax=Methanonatronarchaeum thermophilum TaxID=1927129 RepID=A0A1Y3GHF1_9EURY|nr:toprim domain-containing protein [Methanonatronarchaeum thermophilum]OUJ18865.1 5S rRNA maturation endonuclease containing TOPRIM domain, RnmV [Methanonatronarchaeum thermophilum]